MRVAFGQNNCLILDLSACCQCCLTVARATIGSANSIRGELRRRGCWIAQELPAKEECIICRLAAKTRSHGVQLRGRQVNANWRFARSQAHKRTHTQVLLAQHDAHARQRQRRQPKALPWKRVCAAPPLLLRPVQVRALRAAAAACVVALAKRGKSLLRATRRRLAAPAAQSDLAIACSWRRRRRLLLLLLRRRRARQVHRDASNPTGSLWHAPHMAAPGAPQAPPAERTFVQRRQPASTCPAGAASRKSQSGRRAAHLQGQIPASGRPHRRAQRPTARGLANRSADRRHLSHSRLRRPSEPKASQQTVWWRQNVLRLQSGACRRVRASRAA